jgi:putative hydrolase of the HAD superfamily
MGLISSLQSINVLVFDLDDTLFPERQYVQSGFRAVSEFLQKEKIVTQDVFPAMWHRFIAGERTEIFNRILEECAVTPNKELINRLVLVYRSHRPHITLYEDARDVLGYFFRRRQLALISDGYLQTQSAKLDALKIQHLFNPIILTDQLGREFWKPDPAGFKMVMQSLGPEPDKYVYIGDNPIKDFVAPRRLGWKSICVRRNNAVYEKEVAPDERFEADFLVNDLYQAALLIDPDFHMP